VGASAISWLGLRLAEDELSQVDASVKFISAEPWRALEGNSDESLSIDWLIVGQLTGPGAKPPALEGIESLIGCADAGGVPVFVKPPLSEVIGARQEWPII
jgi:protein gp37